ncbi:dTDP-4-amino-4,6-dideoxygalactose transaminase [compost metagenome]
MFYIKTSDLSERTKLIDFLKENGVMAVFHYVPLHSSEAGKLYSHFFGKDTFTSSESDKLVRLPLYYNIDPSDIRRIIDLIFTYYAVNQ